MITNERQYRITRRKAHVFAQAIEEFDAKSYSRIDVHPRLVRAEREAMESQLADLRDELEQYEKLKSAKISVISVGSFEDLADGLIRARIAGGHSQRALAQRLKLKEQQIQRYEAERYASASYQRLCQVARALDIRIENDILLPVVPDSFEGLLAKVSQVGLSRDFVVGHMLSSADAAIADGEVSDSSNDQRLIAKAAAVLERVFGWRRDDLLGARALPTSLTAAATARFKMPKRRGDQAAGLFATYANHLAVVAIRGMTGYPVESIPTDPSEMRKKILARGEGRDDLRTVLHTVWDHGVVVLPLRGNGTFHGACWRYGGRNAIVLKLTSKHESRWTFDLLHEVFHAAQRSEEEEIGLVDAEAMSDESRDSVEEIAASQFAGDVMLDGKANELAEDCVAQASNMLPRLQRVVRRVAKRRGVSAGALANYLAFRLSWQGLNWWGEAANLQREDEDPWTVVRDVFIERHPYHIEDEIDRSLLDRVLHGGDANSRISGAASAHYQAYTGGLQKRSPLLQAVEEDER